MIECDRCGAEFDEEDDYLRHLGKAHDDDLSDLERKRVGNVEDEPFPWGAAVGGVLIVGVLGVVLYMVMFMGGDDPTGPTGVTKEPGARGSAHYHGQITVIRNGDEVDLSQPEYQLTDGRFHMESRNGEQWHAHATDVTLEYGLKALRFPPSDWERTMVNGESVDPARYVLQEGDAINVTLS